MAWARRIVAAEGSDRPMCLIFPALEVGELEWSRGVNVL